MRARFLLTFLLLGLVAGCSEKESGPPNIIVIITDDHRHDFLGSVSPDHLQTPNLDRLAAEGIRFSNAFVTTSLCSPARATYLTGLYAHTHQVVVNEDMDLQAQTPTIAQRLQKEGYETAFIGKWHMARRTTARPGFDHWISFHGQGHYFTNTLNVDGKWELCKNYITDELTDRAISYLKLPRDKPFLMFLSHKAVHEPFDPADRDRDRFANQALPEFDQPGELRNKAPWKEIRQSESGTNRIKRYRQTLASVDDNLGRLLASLEEQGILDDTVIIYAGDNGYLLGEHGGLYDKRAPFEPSIRVPMIMRYPGRAKAGSIEQKMVLNLDLVPTILDLAGAPEDPDLPGRSMLSGGPGRESFLYEYFASEGKVPTCLAVRTQHWKLVTFPHNPEFKTELFDLQADPGETKNLAGDPAQAETLARLHEQLEKLKKDSNFRWPKY
jgi:N-acetylglucosamine-6-sulfatase